MREVGEIFFVSTNEHKYLEAKEVFDRYGLNLKWYLLEVDEIQSPSLQDIIIWKGYEISKVVNSPFIVEDTGLFIECLNGFPGPYSSYIFKKIGNEGILKLMDKEVNRRAEFISYGLLYFGRNVFKLFRVSVKGEISHRIRGEHGFGYDPIFVPKGSLKTYAEMSLEEKNKFSHRGKLFKEIAEYIVNRGLITGI